MQNANSNNNTNALNVISLFDGHGCGWQALKNNGHQLGFCWGVEIDKYPRAICQKNHPEVRHHDDVRTFTRANHGWGFKFDLVMGGSPCQDLSVASPDRKGLDGERSGLFWEFVRIVEEFKPKYFFLENVVMKQDQADIISQALGVQPITINSKKFSAQARTRMYWTNIPLETVPEADSPIVLQDILEDGYVTDRAKALCIDANYFKGGNLKQYFEKHRRQLAFSADGLCHIGDADLNGLEVIRRVYHPAGKAPTLTTMQGGHREPKVITSDTTWRKLTPLECLRLSGLPDDYADGVTVEDHHGKQRPISNSRVYKACGNGWEVNTVTWLFQNI